MITHKTGAMCLNVRMWGNARRCHTAMGLSSDVFSSSLSMCSRPKCVCNGRGGRLVCTKYHIHTNYCHQLTD